MTSNPPSTMAEIKQQIRSFIEQNYLLTESTPLGDADSLLELQIVDSTGFMELVSFLEGSFGIEVGDDEMVPDNLETIDNIIAFVQRKRAG